MTVVNPTLVERGLYVIRKARDEMLKASDWTVLSDAPLDADKIYEWTQYRNLLRNIPQELMLNPENINNSFRFPKSPNNLIFDRRIQRLIED